MKTFPELADLQPQFSDEDKARLVLMMRDKFEVRLYAPGYENLAAVFQRAFDQAAEGKGKERHAQQLPFDQQPMQKLGELYGVGFMLGQAGKKAQESQRLEHERAITELLGAMNYLAGAVILMERQHKVPHG